MTHVKICGIKSIEDALAAIDAGADYLGFNFYPGSIRHIEPEDCKYITSVLKSDHPSIGLVGVFVNMPVAEIQSIQQQCLLDLVQLHGDESPADVTRLGVTAYKAFRGIPDRLEGYLHNSKPAFLLDASSANAYGGTGKTADWSAAANLARQYPIFLAGGLTPENVADAIAQVHPWGVDAASGVESAPGVKGTVKMRTFVKMVRLADLEMDSTQSQLENL
jgi:phosphoribosylanthranilate isomerase